MTNETIPEPIAPPAGVTLDTDPDVSRGQSFYHVDLSYGRWAFRRTKGDITVFGSWTGANETQSLVLLPTALIGHEGAIPCVVRLEGSWIYSEEIGDHHQAYVEAERFAAALGLFPFDPRNVHRVMSIIRDSLGDLLTMPPKPPSWAVKTVAVADARSVNLETGEVHETEIHEDV